MGHGRTAEGSHTGPVASQDASDDLISPQPLDSPEEVDSSDLSGLSSTSRTSHDEAPLPVKQANAILRLPPEVIDRYAPHHTYLSYERNLILISKNGYLMTLLGSYGP